MSYKSEFPLFCHHPRLTYLDSASTSQKPSFVIDRISQYLSQNNSNIHRGAYDIATNSEELYYWSKKEVGQLIGLPYSQIIYTSNATMGYNMLAQSFWQSGILTAGDHIIISIAEHHANIVPRQMLAARHGIIIDWVGLKDDLTLDYQQMMHLLTDRTKVISLTACSNVLGIVYDFSQVRDLIGERYLLVDASQVIAHQKIDIGHIGADAIIFTGHKMMAETGIGVVGFSQRLLGVLQPIWGGGDMITDVTTSGYTLQTGSQGWEPGTPHIIGAISLGYACQYIQSIGGYEMVHTIESDFAYKLNQVFHKYQDHVHSLNTLDHTDRHIWSFTIDGWTPIRVAERCADHQICIRFGGHCAHPLVRRLGYENGGLCRISSYFYNDDHDIQAIDDAFAMMTQL